jgi:hypothetical protein
MEKAMKSKSLLRRAETIRIEPLTMAVIQGAVYVGAGVWPVVHMPSFEAITGRKRDRWLVRTVGLLLTGIGGSLAYAARDGERARTMGTVGVASAIALTAIDLAYGVPGRIRRVYLLDAALQLSLVAGWAIALAPGSWRRADSKRAGGTRPARPPTSGASSRTDG